MRRNAALILTVILALFAASACRRAGPTPAARVSRIDWAGLGQSVVPPGPDLRTGYLVVPENRKARSGMMIRLPFVIMRSRSLEPSSDPVLISAGGPGGSILGHVRNRARNPLLEDRDVILLEQRGTRFAEPSLTAPRVSEALRSGWGVNLNGDPDPRAVKTALAATLDEYRDRRIDLSGYTTRESAADIADFRRLLGLASWNLYGSSYSTKIVLTVLRDFPEGIRAVVLDSVLTLESNWDEEAPANILDAFDRLIAAAREREPLRARLEGFEERWRGFLEAADRRPIDLTLKDLIGGHPLAVRLDSVGLMNGVYAGLEDPGLIPRLPVLLDEAARGRADLMAPLAEAYLGSSQGFAWGDRLAVWCAEELPFESAARILHPAGLPPELARFVQTAVPVEALKLWPQGHPGPAENLPVRSRVPALIAAGEFDPDTPVAWSRRTASLLENSQFVVFAGMTHVPLFSHPEAGRILRQFLARPLGRINPGKTGERRPFAGALE